MGLRSLRLLPVGGAGGCGNKAMPDVNRVR